MKGWAFLRWSRSREKKFIKTALRSREPGARPFLEGARAKSQEPGAGEKMHRHPSTDFSLSQTIYPYSIFYQIMIFSSIIIFLNLSVKASTNQDIFNLRPKKYIKRINNLKHYLQCKIAQNCNITYFHFKIKNLFLAKILFFVIFFLLRWVFMKRHTLFSCETEFFYLENVFNSYCNSVNILYNGYANTFVRVKSKLFWALYLG